MKDPIDSVAFGLRVRELREEFGWSQDRLGKAAGFSQSNIGWIEQGKGKDPKKQALTLAEALSSSPEWLLHGTGARQTGLRPFTKEQTATFYSSLPPEAQLTITEAIKAALAEPNTKRRAKR